MFLCVHIKNPSGWGECIIATGVLMAYEGASGLANLV